MNTLISLAVNAATDAGLSPAPGAPASRLPGWAASLISHAQSIALLLTRLYVAQVFFLSGLTKIKDWSNTVALFENEYHVPVLSPQVAAAMGAGGELVLPALLAFGLGGRFAAAGLTVLNIVAAISYPDIPPAGIVQHQMWGAMLLGILLFGSGRWSLDGIFAGKR